MYKYKLIISWSDIDQTYIVDVPELPGCKADGGNYQEAVKNAERIIAEWLSTTDGNSKSIPKYKVGVNSKVIIAIVFFIVILVSVFYFIHFNSSISLENATWGTFGDYFGGILNPVIAGFALYLIAKTYDLQKQELQETRKLLEVSTEAQRKQVKLAALTALFNSNLVKVEQLTINK